MDGDSSARLGRNESYLDGNAAAGALSEIFAFDVTMTRGRCEQCGAVTALANARWYPDSHGLVLRCSLCEGVLLRVVGHDDRRCVDLRGLSFLEFTSQQPWESEIDAG